VVPVRYSALLPIEYDAGRWRLQLDGLSPEAVVEFPGGVTPERESSERGVTYQWTESGFGLLGELARIPWSDGTATLDWHLRLASAIQPIPEGARLVVLLDVSRSMTPVQLQRARGLAARWLAGHPSPRVSVLAFHRRVQALTAGFVSADEALRALAVPVTQGNGSFQELALAEGARLLRGVGGESRLLLLSDGHVRDRLEAERLTKALQPNRPWLLYGELQKSGARQPSSPELSALARAHGEHSNCTESPCDIASLLAPTQLDEVVVTPPIYHAGIAPWPLGAVASGNRIAAFGDTLPTKAWSGRVRYRAWGRWQERVFAVDARITEAALAWRTVMEDGCRLEPRWAALSRAVTPEWSYVRRWPGALEGYERPERVSDGGGCGATCDDCGIPLPASNSAYGFNPALQPISGKPWWGSRWREGVAACGAKTARVQLWLDGPEIEDVELLTTGLGTKIDACLREFAWSLEVPIDQGTPQEGAVILDASE
jgi:hypothetical protein